ncbi:AAA family ATPase [Achromobacter xylosoxidans]
MNLQSAREKLGRKLTNVSEVAVGVLRGIRRSNERDVAAYVFDLNNRLPDNVGELSIYLDEVMGPAYFDQEAPPDLRWNNYLYFVVDKGCDNNPSFRATKRNLEADRSYARKFVVNEEDLDRVLDELDSVAVVDESLATTDIVQTWSDGLSAVGLEDVLDGERPIADVVRSISSGTVKQSVRAKKTTGVESSRRLIESHIASINLSGFRSHPRRQSFERLGKANLLFGSNGVGKTSLLEGLEFLYCGANRRSCCSPAASVEGVLASGFAVKTAAQQLLSDFKTRQRLWYGGDDNSRQNKLPNQFARFNFLNTDAAAELSLLKESPKEGTAESLAALLSGHEATLMWRRIQQVRKAVTEETRSKRAERAVAEKDKEGIENELLVLEAAPGQADVAFAVVLKDLEHIGWRNPPESKAAVTERFVGTLSDLTSQLSVIQQLDWLMEPITADAIAQQVSALQKAYAEVENELPAIREDESALSVLAQRHALASSRLVALEAIPPTALADLKALSAAFKQSNDELALNARAYAALPSGAPPEGWESSLGSKSLSTGHAEANAEFHDISSQLDGLQQRLVVSTRTQTELQRAIAELQNWVQKVIEHRHSDSNCPVCGTEFGPGELIQRMHELSLAPSDATISELRQRIEHLNAEKQRAAGEASWLGQLDNFVRSLHDANASLTVRDAQLAVLSTFERQQELLEAKQAAQQGLDAYAQGGFSLEAIERLCRPIDGDEPQGYAPLGVLEAYERTRQYLKQLQDAIAELDARVLQRNERLKRCIYYAGVQSSGTLGTAIEQLRARQRVGQRAGNACTAAHRYLDFAPEADMVSLLTSLEASVLGAKKVQAALQADSHSATRLATAREQLEQISVRLGRTVRAIERLTGAQRILDDIIANQSLDAASAAVVAATHKVADSIFGRIHAPAEYMVTADAETPMRRRDTNLPVQLNQVSTGQRSAYALSMFLAMNAQVKAGPKVILLDDPISHIDDLNALSFLDYLRNLVIKSDRQVFFATADEKIAGLFVHKFSFLGEEFQTIELARG